MKDFTGKIYLGVVEDNNDPERDNKCKVRVINLFDGIPTEDLPWASPFKDNNGIACSLPEVGKIVSIEFENGDIYNPLYRYSEHYNVNLKEKLDSLSDEDYLSMKALLFDHKTQIYTNEGEGLKLDHKFNVINITDESVNLNLKDNFGSVNIGTADASQQAILGNHFLDWFSTFVDHLLGSEGGPYFGNMLAPVLPHPGLITHLLQYKALKDPKFLSHNVNFNDNGYVEKLDRVNKSQQGDDWKSTREKNKSTKTDQPTEYEPKSGTKETTPDGDLTTSEELEGRESPNNEPVELGEGEIHKDVRILIQVLNNKGYKTYTEPNELNIVGVRFQYEGDEYTNKFTDKIYVFYKDDDEEWKIKNWKISTMPGTIQPMRDRNGKLREDKYKKFKQKVSRKSIGKTISLKKYAQYVGRSGLGILQPAQYVNSYELGIFSQHGALRSIGKQLAFRDSNWDSKKITYSSTDEGNFGMHLHRAFPGGVNVNNWSEGCQVFSNKPSLNSFIKLCEIHKQKHGNKFTYTLITSNDFDEADQQIQAMDEAEKEEITKIGKTDPEPEVIEDPEEPEPSATQSNMGDIDTYGEFTLTKTETEYVVEPEEFDGKLHSLDFGSTLYKNTNLGVFHIHTDLTNYNDDEATTLFRKEVDILHKSEELKEKVHPNAEYERDQTGFYRIIGGKKDKEHRIEIRDADNNIVEEFSINWRSIKKTQTFSLIKGAERWRFGNNLSDDKGGYIWNPSVEQ